VAAAFRVLWFWLCACKCPLPVQFDASVIWTEGGDHVFGTLVLCASERLEIVCVKGGGSNESSKSFVFVFLRERAVGPVV
jgi:hypothetical protein